MDDRYRIMASWSVSRPEGGTARIEESGGWREGTIFVIRMRHVGDSITPGSPSDAFFHCG